MAISVTRDSPTWQDMTANAEDVITEALRDLARWLYRQLEREYEYLTSDERQPHLRMEQDLRSGIARLSKYWAVFR